MKLKLVTAALIFFVTSATHAQTPAFSYCGTYGAYVMLYKNTDQFELLGKLRCGEKLEVLGKWFDYLQVRTLDGKVGWVRAADVSGGPAATPSPTPFGMTSSPVQASQREVVVALTNKNILSMQAMRLSPDVIIAKIKASATSFDTSAAGLQKLKYAGVPDKVIVAMVTAPVAVATAAVPDSPKPPDFVQVKVPDGTPVEIAMTASVSSDAVREGTIIHMKVVNDVVINGVAIFQKDSEARARVYVITQPTFMGKSGEISWAMQDITAVNGDQLPATFTAQEPGSATPSGSSVEDTGTTWQFHKNKPTTMPAGYRMRATIHGNITLKIPAALATQSSAPADSAPATSQNIQASHETLQTPSADNTQKP